MTANVTRLIIQCSLVVRFWGQTEIANQALGQSLSKMVLRLLAHELTPQLGFSISVL